MSVQINQEYSDKYLRCCSQMLSMCIIHGVKRNKPSEVRLLMPAIARYLHVFTPYKYLLEYVVM